MKECDSKCLFLKKKHIWDSHVENSIVSQPICPWGFCWKTRFEASQLFFWSLSFNKELKLTTKLFTGHTLCGLLMQMQNISLRSSGIRRKQNFRNFWVSKWHSSLDFYFSLSLLPSFFAFLASFCFSLAGHLVGFILVGKVFNKAFRILGLDERKGRRVVEQNFHGNFQVNITWFFAF